jgi:hypothetical protein
MSFIKIIDLVDTSSKKEKSVESENESAESEDEIKKESNVVINDEVIELALNKKESSV